MSPYVPFFFFILVSTKFSLSSSESGGKTGITVRTCTNRTAPGTDLDSFNENFRLALSVAFTRTEFLGYGFDVEGDIKNSSSPVVYAYSDCFKGMSSNDCTNWLGTALDYINSCPVLVNGTRGGLVFVGPSFLRYDDHDFRTETLSSTVADKSSLVSECGNETASPGFRDMADEFLKKMSLEAPKNAGFYLGNVNQAIYGVARCFEYVNITECERCLTSAASKGKECLSKSEGAVVNYGCFIKYAPYDLSRRG